MDADRTHAGTGAGRTVRVDEPVPGVRVITLDRPHRLDAMSGELISDLRRALDDAGASSRSAASRPGSTWRTGPRS